MVVDALSLPPGELLKRIESALADVPRDQAVEATVVHLATAIVERLGSQSGLLGGRVYRREIDGYHLIAVFGRARMPDEPVVLANDYPPVVECLAAGVVYCGADSPGLDLELEARLGASSFAGIVVDQDRYLLSFDLEGSPAGDAGMLALGVLRHGLVQRIRQERVHDVYREARRIQTSILPRQAPEYGPFDLAGRSDPMESVGGDYFDFISLSPKILGLAVADVTGHGLPAALQVRDIYMGLRMGLGRDFKIVSTVERLSRLIHESTLNSRFASMVYGELEINGNFLYVNAGHPPPFLLAADDRLTWLESGGPVMGPLPEPSYERGFVKLKPGDVLVIYSDGIVETSCGNEENPVEFGVERLVEVVRRARHEPAAAIVEQVYAALLEHCDGAGPGDDRTLMVVRYPESALSASR